VRKSDHICGISSMQSIEGWNPMHGASAVEDGNRNLLLIIGNGVEVNMKNRCLGYR